MSCLSKYATADEYVTMMCSDDDTTDPETLSMIELFLELSAGDINAAIASSGMCDCTWGDWVMNYLKKLNIIDAAVIKQCPCGNMPEESKAMWLEWIDNQLELIRSGQIELCQNHTAVQFPAFDEIQRGWNEFSQADIINNTLLKSL